MDEIFLACSHEYITTDIMLDEAEILLNVCATPELAFAACNARLKQIFHGKPGDWRVGSLTCTTTGISWVRDFELDTTRSSGIRWQEVRPYMVKGT